MAQHPLRDSAEQPPPHRNRDLSFYLVLLFCVVPVWSAVPVSWLFVIHTLGSGKFWSFSGLWWTLFILTLLEVNSCSHVGLELGYRIYTLNR
jgi:hypothetical protein